jgi:hypothetical protein
MSEVKDVGALNENDVRAALKPTVLPNLVLPSAEVPYIECAAACFPLLAQTQKFFIRNRSVVQLVTTPDGKTLVELDPEEFKSYLEKRFNLAKWVTHNGQPALKPSRCSLESAKTLLVTEEARELLPPIRTITNAPIFVEGTNPLGWPCVNVQDKGYYNIRGGILVLRDHKFRDVGLDESVSSLLGLLQDWDFVDGSDKSRALASLLSPALRLGGLLDFDFPLDLAEADQSQAGKSYRQKVIAQLYGEDPFVITKQEEVGVGSMDERISSALLSGRAFVILENVRKQVNSQLLEAILRGQGYVSVRAAYSRVQMISTSGVVWMLSSNRAETTPDLANRSIITRIRKRPEGYLFKKFKEGDLLAHVKANSGYYLSCILTVLNTWVRNGKPRTDDTRHDFREWCQSLDWIVQKVFKLPPLLDGHRSEQERISNPDLNFLREVALIADKAGRLDEKLRAGEIVGLCEAAGLAIPNMRTDADENRRTMHVGRILGNLFKETTRRELSGYTVDRSQHEEYDVGQRRNLRIYRYEITSK